MADTTLEQQLIDLLDDRDLTTISITAGATHRGEVKFNAYAHGGGMVGSSGNCGSIHGALQEAIAALVAKRFGGDVRPLRPIRETAA